MEIPPGRSKMGGVKVDKALIGGQTAAHVTTAQRHDNVLALHVYPIKRPTRQERRETGRSHHLFISIRRSTANEISCYRHQDTFVLVVPCDFQDVGTEWARPDHARGKV